MRTFIETHFGTVLFFSCFAGLFLPGLPKIPSESVVVALALLMFLSCCKLRDGGLETIRWRDVLLFYVLRYMALPVGLWFIAHALVPQWATGVFLLAVLPAGVASPAFANIYGGAVPPAFAIVILSQIAAPLLIPMQFAWESSVSVAPSPYRLFITMVWCIFLPMAAYALFRKHRSNDYIYARNKLFSVLLIAFIIALAIAKQRDVILLHGTALFVPFIIVLLCYACYIVFGWFCARGPRSEHITFAACSSFNNAALGVSLALLHFGPPEVLFMAVSEIGWALLPWMFRGWLMWGCKDVKI